VRKKELTVDYKAGGVPKPETTTLSEVTV
jgi:hypothetical protein